MLFRVIIGMIFSVIVALMAITWWSRRSDGLARRSPDGHSSSQQYKRNRFHSFAIITAQRVTGQSQMITSLRRP